MTLFQTVVGIDPSGRRLALAAVRVGVAGPAPHAPAVSHELRGDREQARLEEAEALLGEYVARNRLSGNAARLCVPADRVYVARVTFPPLKDRDLRAALELELERLFPVPPSTLRFAWRTIGDASGKKLSTHVVAAAPAAYLEAWEEIASRAGLALRGAVPAGWAVWSARSFAAAGAPPGLSAILRDAGGGVEGTLASGGEPVFTARRACPEESMPAEGLALLEDALVDAPAPEEEGPVALFAPPGWFAKEDTGVGTAGNRFRLEREFERAAAAAVRVGGGADEASAVWKMLGAFGAAADGRTMDLLAPPGGGAASRMGRVGALALAVLTVLLAVAWPSTLALRTSAELRRLDAEIEALRPAVADVEKSLGDLAAVRERIGVLGEGAASRGEALSILRELTGRLPDGTWLTGLRVEDRKVELDGLSPSASEIFPLLTQDGRFRGVEFASPITRQPDNLERFRIRAEFVPPEPGAGEGGR